MTYTDIMQSAGKEIDPSIYYTSNGTTTTLNHDDIISAKLYFNAPLVGTIMKGLSVEVNQTLPTNTAIYFKNVATLGEDTANKVYGPYYVKETEYNADTKTYTIELYDEFLNAMVDYEPITIAYPTTVFSFFSQLLTELGFTTQIASLPNGTQPVDSDIYDGINYTYRDVLDDIAQATGSCFKISGGEISLATLGTTAISIDDDILKNQNIDFGEHYGAINTIVLSRGGGADNIYYPDPLPATPIEFKITDNQLMNTNDRSDYMGDIYDQLNGIEYDIYDTELVGYGGFNPLDKITISTIDEAGNTKTYNSYVFNDEQVFTQGYSETIYTAIPDGSVSDYKVMTPTDKIINQTNLIVDKVNNQIISVVEASEQAQVLVNGKTEYELTTDETYQSGKTYYVRFGNEYSELNQYSTYTGPTTGDPSELGLYEGIYSYTYSLTDDTEFDDEDYYEKVDDEYVLYTGPRTGNPHELGLYNKIANLEGYQLTEDASFVANKTYFTQNYAIGGTIPENTIYEAKRIPSVSEQITGLSTEFDDKLDNYATITSVQTSVETLQTNTYSKTQVNQIVDGTGVDGVVVSKTITESGIFDKDGLLIQKEDDEGTIISNTSGRFNEKGVQIKTRNDEEIFFSGYVDDNRFGNSYQDTSIVYTRNLLSTGYTEVGIHGRFESYTDINNDEGVGFFII